MWIDFLSVRNLELVQNLQNPRSSQCLLGVLDHCQTPMGKRLLRANILQPSAGNCCLCTPSTLDVKTIEARLNAVEEMIGRPDMYHDAARGTRFETAKGSSQRLPGF